MPFRLLRFLDQVLGTVLFFAVVPLCGLLSSVLSPRNDRPQRIAILKLHGGGSLLIALPALLGLRKKYPQAIITLIGTGETQKFAELTGVFDRYVLVNSGSIGKLTITGVKALAAAFRHDIFLDFEPHSNLAAVFTPLTFSGLRIGFVKAGEHRRQGSYTHPIYFNLHAPIYTFYEQAVSILGAEAAGSTDCRSAMKDAADHSQTLLPPAHLAPVVYISAFTSSLSPERMMPDALWVEHLQKKFTDVHSFTVILGGGKEEAERAVTLAAAIRASLPAADITITCGTRSLRQSVGDIDRADLFWGVDSGPLHIARCLGKICVSFWGPSNPVYRLRPIEGLNEQVLYRAFPCSPCVHMGPVSPCRGDNQCMKKLFASDVPAPLLVP